MNCPRKEDWDLLAIEALDGSAARPLLAHLLECPDCRTIHEQARRAHLDRIRMYDQLDRGHDSLREQLMSALPPEPVRSHADRLVRGWRHTGDFAMSIQKKFGARATIGLVSIAACLVFIFLATTFASGKTAFASAIQQFQKARTIVCRVSSSVQMPKVTAPMQTLGKFYFSADYGSRCEMYLNGASMMVQYAPLNGPMTSVTPLTKTYTVVDNQALSGGQQSGNSPDAVILALAKLKGQATRELGRASVDGIDSLGYEISGQLLGIGAGEGIRSELWVDAKTFLPVRYIAELPLPQPAGTGTCQLTYDQFEWDTVVDPQLFVPEIPAGFTRLDATTPVPDEAALIKGLGNYAELTGKYPPTLDAMAIVTDFSSAVVSRMAAARARGEKGMDQQLIMQKAVEIGSGIAFYQKLVSGKRSPEYFGKTIKPGQADAVLLRWKPVEGQWRIVYGDLRMETISAP